jgi:hypothetical protein
MKKELTTEQINRLYRYVNDKGVEYFDIQIELVDHIASIIEERWNNYSEQSVDETLNGVLVAFEKYGFKRLVREKERQVARQYRRYFWQNFKSFFSWPKVLFTAVLTWVLFEFIQKTNVNALQQISDSLMFPILGIALIYGIFLFVRRLLMLRKLSFTSYNIGGGFILFNTYSTVKLILKYSMLQETPYPLIASFLLVLFFLMIVAALQAHEKLYTYSKQLYPQAFA